MNNEEYRALLNEVLESNALAKKNNNELTKLRGEVVKLDGSVTSLRGDIIILSADLSVNTEDVAKINSKLDAMMQTIDGMNHLAKSAYDMASSNVTSIRRLERLVGKPLIDEQPQAVEANSEGGAAGAE